MSARPSLSSSTTEEATTSFPQLPLMSSENSSNRPHSEVIVDVSSSSQYKPENQHHIHHHPLSRKDHDASQSALLLLDGHSEDEEEEEEDLSEENRAFIHSHHRQHREHQQLLTNNTRTTSLTSRETTRNKNPPPSSSSSQKELVSLHIRFPKYYLTIAKHMLIFMGVMMLLAMCSGFVFRESTKWSVPYFRVGEYAYQQGTLIHGHFFTIGVFIPLALLVMLFVSYMISGMSVSRGIFHGGFIIFEIGAILALLAFCYKAFSFLSLLKESPNVNIHELELRTWGSTSSYGGKNDGSGSMGAKMLRMVYFGLSHGFMLIGLAKCVLVVVYSLLRKKNN
ncbi:hypothetical protein FDP41_005533 [Naegleria fowleri]|uniref:Uncharacterized protein n=1 Tax=Naegleria fowleri TaxID=5763 RepID=A0A6A5BRG2_NAEFO|nr:uncharacterized protein FDP41_005533 [Naegleria fowleri]KAF0975539.1 hypothetical protein FDP41_005533 [Naegleria fowleri]CAG4718019.1 unnamed protein product [Naegleria fowleri]